MNDDFMLKQKKNQDAFYLLVLAFSLSFHNPVLFNLSFVVKVACFEKKGDCL